MCEKCEGEHVDIFAKNVILKEPCSSYSGIIAVLPDVTHKASSRRSHFGAVVAIVVVASTDRR